MSASRNRLGIALNAFAIVLLVVLVAGWVESAFWRRGPNLLGVSEQIFAAMVFCAWLAWRGFQFFGKQREVKLLRVFEEKDRRDD